MPIRIIQHDITTLHVDAIVNAANSRLLGGGGVDGAIHRAAGPALLAACRDLPESTPGVRCPTSEARITPGFDLPAHYVIHTVGPIWQDDEHDEPSLLQNCYRQSLRLLRNKQLHSIAFPAISCGVYGYPAEKAARVAVTTVLQALQINPDLDITLCCYSESMRVIFQRAFDNAINPA